MGLLREVGDYLVDNAEALALRAAVVVAIAVGGYIVARASSRAAGRAVRRGADPRRLTLAPIVQTLVHAVVFGAALVTALGHAGLDVGAILAGAGILGLAVGFGAQSLVKDCISGFFLILDGVVAEGDIVRAGDKSGTVERVGLRLTEIRSFDGTLWYIPNGQIDVVGNFTRDWMRAVVEVGLAYEQDVARGMQVLQEVGDTWAKENERIVLEPPEVQGVLGLNDSAVGIRLIVKLDNRDKVVWGAERELRKRTKDAFDAAGVEIPFPRQVVYHRQEDGGRLQVVSGGA